MKIYWERPKKLNRWGTTVTMLFSCGLSRLIWNQNTLLTMDSPFSFCDWSITSFVFSSPIVLPSFAIASTVNSDDSSAFYCYIEQPFGIEVHIHKCISALHEIRYLCGAKDEVCNFCITSFTKWNCKHNGPYDTPGTVMQMIQPDAVIIFISCTTLFK